MKRLITFLGLVLVTFVQNKVAAQIVATAFTNNNGSGTVVFNLQNTNNYDVEITGIEGAVGTSGTTSAGMWYKTTPISGAPGAISSSNGWNVIATGTFAGVAVTSGTSTQTFLSNLSFILPANTTYGIAVCAYSGTSGRQRYSTLSAGSYVATTGGVKILSGTNISYASGVPPTAPTIANRGLVGKIHFMPACENPSGLAATNVTTAGATINWSPVAGSLGYEYVLDQNPASPAGPGTLTATTSYNATGLTINTTYYFHVRNKCSNTFSGWTNFTFTTADAYCKPPVNVLYSNITMNSADVLWALMPTSDHYEYMYDLTPNFVLLSQNAISTHLITAKLINLLPDTKYYMYIRSICLGGSDSSTWRLDSFMTQPGCNAPDVTILSATQSAWWHPVAGVQKYEYRTTSSPATPSFGEETSDTAISYTLPNDLTDQYLHVRCKCKSQFTFSEWTTKAVRQIPAGINDLNNNMIEIYPNPAKDNVYIKNAKDADVIIMDMAGRVLLQQKTGDDVSRVSIANLPIGVYLLKINKDKFSLNSILKKN